MRSTSDDLGALLRDVESVIEHAVTMQLQTTVLLLRIARLDLITILHGIEDDELKAFSELVGNAAFAADQLS